MADWAYDPRRQQYWNAGGTLTGRDLTRLRNEFLDRAKPEAARLGSEFAAGRIGADEFRDRMTVQISDTYAAQAALGRGGFGQLTDTDRETVRWQVEDQVSYLDGFVEAVGRGEVSEAQGAARAGLYVESSTQAFERGRAAAYDVELPQYPGDGQTACASNCRCEVEYEQTAEALLITWHAEDDAGTCDDCAALAAEWSPLVISFALE